MLWLFTTIVVAAVADTCLWQLSSFLVINVESFPDYALVHCLDCDLTVLNYFLLVYLHRPLYFSHCYPTKSYSDDDITTLSHQNCCYYLDTPLGHYRC